MIRWNSLTLLRILLPFSCGIVAGVFLINPSSLWPVLFVLGIFLLVILNLPVLHARFFSFHWIYGLFINITVFSGSLWLTHQSADVNYDSHLFHQELKEKAFMGVIYEPIRSKPRSYQTAVRVKWLVDTVGAVRPVTGNVLVYLKKDSLSEGLKIGDLILFKNVPVEVQEPSNPSQFNYKRYLAFHDIYHQVYLDTGNWQKLAAREGSGLRFQAHRARDNLLEVFRRHQIEGQEFAVLSALMLGYKDELGPEITRAFSSAGAMHVLAVSGLHVGMVYLAIGYLLFFLNRNSRLRKLKIVIIILFLWVYAGLTGFSPSVLRASTMFTFIAVGGMFKRKSSIYNMLAASALFLLVIDPFLIMSVGFQLSYLAVTGIVMLYPWIYHLVNSRFWLVDKIWSLTAVSASAQLATFPLAMLYFHQFPNYFIFSNLIVIPLVTAIIYVGLLTFIAGFFHPLQSLLATVLEGLVKFLNQSVFMVESLPYAITEHISISNWEVWLMYMTVGLLMMFIEWRNVVNLQMALVGILCLAVIQFVENQKQVRQMMFVVYDIRQMNAISFISGRDQLLLADSSVTHDADLMLFYMRNFWDDRGIKRTTAVVPPADAAKEWGRQLLMNRYPFLGFAGIRILILEDDFKPGTNQSIRVDYLIVSGSKIYNKEKLLDTIEAEMIIIHSSVKHYAARFWEEQSRKRQIPVHTVSETGHYWKNFD